MSEAPSLQVKPTWIVLAVLLVAIGLGSFVSFPLMLIFLAASALCAAIFLLWASLQTAGEIDEMEFEEALSFSAPATEEEQKIAVLRALKDLEYERSLGKITQEDYEQAKAEYRASAKRLIAAEDAAMKDQLQAAERRVAKFLETQPVGKESTSEDSSEAPA